MTVVRGLVDESGEPPASPLSASPPPADAGGAGVAAREQRAAALDAWLASLFQAAGAETGAALLALGGLGRRECAPHGDLDLVLLHAGRDDVSAIAEKIWYPIWDAGLTLDHSVRTHDQAVTVAQG